MPQQVSREQALSRRREYRTPGGALTWVSTYLGTNKMELLAQGRASADGKPTGPAGPMAYLVEQAAGHTVDPHFHEVQQFQLFVGGSGRIGTHPLEGVCVHYAGPHSPYGPIVAGDAGVQYVTLRPGWDPGAQWMPAAAPALRAIPGRQHVAFTSEPIGHVAPAALGGASATQVMPSREDGAAAWVLRAGPGQALQAPGDAAVDRFWYVLAGSVRSDDGGEACAPGACIHFRAGEVAAFQAGAQGAEVIQVRFAAA